jgi:hypothetical protein
LEGRRERHNGKWRGGVVRRGLGVRGTKGKESRREGGEKRGLVTGSEHYARAIGFYYFHYIFKRCCISKKID